MPGKNIFHNLQQMDTSYLLDPSIKQELNTEDIDVKNDKPKTLKISQLVAFKNHPFRIDIESEKFLELIDSIKENGIIQPILVRPINDDKYEILAGHCRTEAADPRYVLRCRKRLRNRENKNKQHEKKEVSYEA